MNVGALGGREGVLGAIRGAATATGVDFDFLLRTAQRESSLNPAAKARTSSAAGLFQFVEQTWLSTVKAHGAKHGLGQYADMIERGPGGRLTVSDPDTRRKVLDLRLDATASSVMGAELASDHASYLKGRIGRAPTSGELYAAHFLGPAGSAKLIRAQEQTPGAQAAALFPAAARANRSIFYGASGARSVSEVYARLTRSADSAVASVAAAVERPVAAASAMVERVMRPATITVRELTTPVRIAVREAAAPAVRAISDAVSEVTHKADPVREAMRRAETSRRDAMLIDLILGESDEAGASAKPFSAELLSLLAARER